jgi:hypothetical protein
MNIKLYYKLIASKYIINLINRSTTKKKKIKEVWGNISLIGLMNDIL